MTTIGIVQSNYIPWRGYFDLIRRVDVFVILDDVQYTRRDWRNRNRIKLPDGGSRWLSVPVLGGRDQLIRDVILDHSQPWSRKHLEALRHSYARSPCFASYQGQLAELFEPKRFRLLVDLNLALSKAICEWLGLTTRFVRSSDLDVSGRKDDRLLAIVRRLNGDAYLSGPAAKSYIRPEIWTEARIELNYMDYSGYPSYPQIGGTFEPAVSALDLLFMVGDEAPDYIWGKHRAR